MKNLKNIFLSGSFALAALLFVACQQEESPVAKAVLTSEQYIEFNAENAAPVDVTVYSDGNWVADYPSWITLSQTSGQSGTTEGITITAADNKDAEGILPPRRDTVKFHGNKLISYSYVIVYQKGDKYHGLVDKSLAEVAALSDGEFCSVNGVQVVAVEPSGFIISDASALMYLKSKQSVKVGDILTFKGFKSTSSGLSTITDLEDFVITSNKDVTYPAATDITSTLASYSFKAYDYVSVSGVFNGSKLTVDGVDKAITASASADKALGSLAGHRVTLTGYLTADNSANYTMVVTDVQDNGLLVVFNLPFVDDFEWLEPWTTASSAGDAVGTSNPSSTAPNIFTAATCEGVVDELANRGYSIVNGWKGQDYVDISLDPSKSQNIVYLQTNYLKFGKTSYNAGIILPAFNGLGSRTADVELSFDWCWQLTAKMKPDVMTITVELQGNGTLEQSVFESSQPTEGDLSIFEWQTVKVAIKGIDAGTRIIIRPTNADPSISSTRDQNRWYLDNISVVPEGGESSVSFNFTDDFEWVAPWATAASAGDAVSTNNPSTTAPNVYTSAACAGFLAELAGRGYGIVVGAKDSPWSQPADTDSSNPKVLYLQSNYLKFGKTDYNAGIILPPLTELGDATADLELSFDWCWQITGLAKPDTMTLTVEIAGSGSVDVGRLESAQSTVDGESKIEWQRATVNITGAKSDTRITIRPSEYDPNVENPARRQNRWYLDNISLVSK